MFAKRIKHILLIKGSVNLRKLIFEQNAIQNISYSTPAICKNIFIQYSLTTNNVFNKRHIKKYEIIRHCNNAAKNETNVTESKWAHKILEASPAYRNTVTFSPTPKEVSKESADKLLLLNWDEMSSEELVTNFQIVSSYIYQKRHDYSGLNYHHVLESVSKSLAKLSNDQIHDVLQHIQLWRNLNKESAYEQFLKDIDKECLNRVKTWSLEGKLLTCDLFFLIPYSNKSQFYWHAMRRLSYKLHQMSLPNIIHYIFLLNINKSCVQNMYEIEYHTEKYLPEMTSDEVSILALCFYKRRTQTRSVQFLKEIFNKSLKNFDNMTSFNIAAIMKFIRSFRNLNAVEEFRMLLQACTLKIPELDLLCLTHILHATANMTVYDEKLMSLIVERFLTNLSQVRVKDIERLTYALAVFNYNSDHPIYQKIIDELNSPERNKELETYSKCVPVTLMYLAQSSVYPIDIIEKVMHHDYIKKLYNLEPYRIGLEYLFLDQSLEIERPEYRGPRLSKENSNLLSKRFKSKIPDFSSSKLSNYNKIVMDVIYESRQLLGDTSVIVDHVLPHYLKPDVIIALDKDDKPLPVQQIFSSADGIKYIPAGHKDDVKWLVLIIGTNYSCIAGTCIGIGFITSKMRQLRRLGYIPILIPCEIWEHLSDNKKTYLQSLLLKNPSVQNNETEKQFIKLS